LAKILNRYFIEDEKQYLEVTKRSGEKVYFIIDKNFLTFVRSKLWYAMYCPKRKSHYLESRDKIRFHRYVTNCPDNLVVDHANRCTYDNRIKNLRICTVAENNKNRHYSKRQRNPKSTNTGVNYITYCSNGGGRYYYYVRYDKDRKTFNSMEEAIMFLNKLKQKERVEV
jgi:hypothetical protein